LYTIQWVKDDSKGGDQRTVEQPIEYINNLWHTIHWSHETRTYYTDPGDILPEGFKGLGHEDNTPGPSYIPPPTEPIHEPLHTGTTFQVGILDTLAGTAANPTQQSSPIPSTPFSPTSVVASMPPILVPPPIQVQSMSTSTPVAAQSTIVGTTPADDKGSLKGKQPPVFDGTRAKADTFWRAFKIYRILNKESDAIKKPFNRTALALSFIAGPNVDDWSKHQLDQLEEKILTTNLQRYAEKDERLWTEFKTDFQNAFQDTTRTQDAYTALMQLEMKGKDIDTYIATFDRLVG
jgi:hypothetical protein